jgi:hypothetical protein
MDDLEAERIDRKGYIDHIEILFVNFVLSVVNQKVFWR